MFNLFKKVFKDKRTGNVILGISILCTAAKMIYDNEQREEALKEMVKEGKNLQNKD